MNGKQRHTNTLAGTPKTASSARTSMKTHIENRPSSTRSRAQKLRVALALGAATAIAAGCFLFYPYLKDGYDRLRGNLTQTFVDETAHAGLKRHHAGANWLGTFSVSVMDYDNDGHADLFVNNHERHRPYFYRNNGDATFSEAHEEIGILENPVGPVFGAPQISSAMPGFFVWLDPATRLSGTWHIRWIAPAATPVSGTVTTNAQIARAGKIGFSATDTLRVEGSTVHFTGVADGTPKGIDLTSTFPESTVEFDLRYDGQADPLHVRIGPRNVTPPTLPFSLSLGDRHATAWGDFDNDGRTDLFVTRGAMVGLLKPPHGAKSEELFRNGPDARFSNVIHETGIRNDYGRGRDAQWVDYDKDGRLDLYVSNLGSRNLLFRNLGNGAFEETASRAGLDLTGHTHFVWADFNGDGHPDILFSNPERLFLNDGKGRFSDVTEASGVQHARRYTSLKDAMFWGSGAAVADFNNDGSLDLFIASGIGGGESRLLEGRNGKFTDVTNRAGLNGLQDVTEGLWGDFDNDGLVDLYAISPHPASNRLYRNQGDGTFVDVTHGMNLKLTDRLEWSLRTHAGGVATWMDYNGDGFLDLFLATRRPKDIQQQKSPAATDGKTSPEPLSVRILAFMKGKTPGTHFLLRNTGNGNGWIKVRLSGKGSNRSGYGAKVFVTTPAGTQFQEAGAGTKLLFAQNDVPLHFGLGRFGKAATIRVIWPDGREQVLKDVAANQVVQINEASDDHG